MRYAIRRLIKSPGFSLTVIVTIALGIGANTAIFTLVHAVLLKSLPVVDPKTLYRVGDKDDCCVNGGFLNDDGDMDMFSYELYRQFRDTTPEFEQLAAMQSGGETMTVRRGSEAAKALPTQYVSGNFFSTFGIGPFAGRMLNDEDDNRGAAPVAVMSYQAWQSEYGGDSSLVGSTLYLNGEPITIVGIAPPGFFGDRIRARPPAVWIPLGVEPLIAKENPFLPIPDSNWLYVIGRLKPGVSTVALQDKMSNNMRLWMATIGPYVREGRASVIKKQHVVIVPGGAGIQNLQQDTGKGLYLLMSLSGLLLLIACANVANLMLARGTTRRAETSIRMAMGAARTQLIGQTLTESVLLACLGGLAGLSVAYAGARVILALAFPRALEPAHQQQPLASGAGIRFPSVSVDWRTVRHGAGVDHLSFRSRRGPARRQPLDRRSFVVAAEIPHCGTGGDVVNPPDRRGAAHQEPQQSATSGFRNSDCKPLCCAHRSDGRGIHAGEAARVVPGAGATLRRGP